MIAAAVRRAIVLALLWWAISGGVVPSLLLAAASIAAALALSLVIAPPGPRRIRWSAVLSFVPFFASRSLIGAIRVLRLAVHPALPISPGYVRVPVAIERGTPRALLMCLVNLMPGTITVAEKDDVLTLHVIDRTTEVDADVRALEERVQAMLVRGIQDARPPLDRTRDWRL